MRAVTNESTQAFITEKLRELFGLDSEAALGLMGQAPRSVRGLGATSIALEYAAICQPHTAAEAGVFFLALREMKRQPGHEWWFSHDSQFFLEDVADAISEATSGGDEQ